MRQVKARRPAAYNSKSKSARRGSGRAKAKQKSSWFNFGAALPGSQRGGRGKQQQPLVLRWFHHLREGSVRNRPALTVLAALFVGIFVYGLYEGGHLRRAGDAMAGWADDSLRRAGFSIDQVTVAGRNRTDAARILDALKVERGASLFGFDVVAARQRLERLDWVKSATVMRLWPDTIHVVIEERVPFALWQRGGRLALIDSGGLQITQRGLDEFAHLPLVVGHGANRHARDVVALLAQRPVLDSRVQAAVRVGDRRWNLRLDNGVDVKLPEEGVAQALDELMGLDRDYRILARDIDFIDLRLDDRLIVRLPPDAAARRDAAIEGRQQKKAGADT